MKDLRFCSNSDLRNEISQLLSFRDLALALFVGFAMPETLMNLFSKIQLAFTDANSMDDPGKARAYLLDGAIHAQTVRRDLKDELWNYLTVALLGLAHRVRQYKFDADLTLGRVRTIKKDIEALQDKMHKSIDLIGLGKEFRLIEKKVIEVEELQASRVIAHHRARAFAQSNARPLGRTGDLMNRLMRDSRA